jgi:pimeloyl-ACP methyl ester carboxylesterase
MKMQRIVYEGSGKLKLVADARGDSGAPPVLFLHGSGQTRNAWRRTAEVVADAGWRAISLDLRGHGESDWAQDGDYSLKSFCADCLKVIRQLDRPPVLVGASLGGMIAILVEGESDESVARGLVLVDIATKASMEGVERITTFMQSGIKGFESLEEAGEAIAAYTPRRNRSANLEGLRKVLRQREGRWHWHWDPQFMNRDHDEKTVKEYEDLLNNAMRHIDVPTMLVRGELSDVLTKAGVDDVKLRFPKVEVVEVDGAAHMIAGDQNDAFTEAVISFLDKNIRSSPIP